MLAVLRTIASALVLISKEIGKVDMIITKLTEMDSKMATQDDINALAGRLDTVSTTIETGISGIRSDIDDLKAANPGLDTTALEASVAKLEGDAGSVTELDGENPGVPAEPPVDGAPTPGV